MDLDRSAKRRKTDDTEDTLLIDSKSKNRALPVDGKNSPSKAGRVGALDQAADGAASAEAIWQKAKGQSASYRARARANLNRQRTSETAQNGQAERHQLGNQAEPVQQTSGKLKPVKKQQLDPLRNHRQLGSSPQKPAAPSPGTGALGFFKQFRSPKKGAEDSASPLKLRDKLVQAKADSERTSTVTNGTRRIVNADDQEDELARDVPTPATTRRSSGTSQTEAARTPRSLGASKSIAHKTFEDEIREIEAQAQETARTEEDEDVNAVRRTGRRPCPKRMADDPIPDRADADDSIVVAKALDRRKPKKLNSAKLQSPEPSKVPEIKLHQTQVDHTDHPTTPSKRAGTSTEPLKKAPSAAALPKQTISLDPAHLQVLQGLLLEKVTGHRPVRLANLDDERAKVSSLVLQTITAGESNSLLLIGARGSGKSALVDAVLREQAAKHADQFHVVRLNGFLQTDDKIALREIWRQLGRDMGVIDEHESASRNVADTLATLLALLSHPAEMGQEPAQDQISKSVVFIIDEFDLFAHHPRQTLLYNLFDIAQSRKAPIAVIGLTTKFNVTEQLEKRVKSRFSHRYVHLSLPKSFSAFQDVIRAALAIEDTDLSSMQLGENNYGGLTDNWINILEHLLADEALETHLRRIYYTTKLVSDVFASLAIPLATLPTTTPLTSETLVEHFKSSLSANPILPPDSKLTLLPSLSTLQLALLICAARLVAIYSMDTVNFLLVYEEYKTLASKAKLQATASGMAGSGAGARLWSKDVASGAWEDLLEIGLILEDGRGGAGSGKCEVGLEEIGRSSVDLGSWGRWCREI